MRKLKTKDIFEAMRIIKKAGLKEDIKPVLKLATIDGVSIADVGIEGILTIIETLTEKKAEDAFYGFLAGPFEMEVSEVEELDLTELMNNLETLGRENNLKHFFTILSNLITSKQ